MTGMAWRPPSLTKPAPGGPFCDVVEGKQRYVTYLREVIAPLQDHRLAITRISRSADHVSYVELTESFLLDGDRAEYPECIVFEQGDDGLINYVSVFIKQPGEGPRT